MCHIPSVICKPVAILRPFRCASLAAGCWLARLRVSPPILLLIGFVWKVSHAAERRVRAGLRTKIGVFFVRTKLHTNTVVCYAIYCH